ncbi:hypothetical protein KL907_002525 [Ogataea polymorpha]|nr:hypothetical protein KL907_002525 [Ogataea polymorpha]KAG7910132.1 hypothetical protein KL906_002037 [Ogataea polymorpha]
MGRYRWHHLPIIINFLEPSLCSVVIAMPGPVYLQAKQYALSFDQDAANGSREITVCSYELIGTYTVKIAEARQAALLYFLGQLMIVTHFYVKGLDEEPSAMLELGYMMKPHD